MQATRGRNALAAIAPFAVVAAVAGCGGSSKPQYCTDRSKLEQSLKDLGNTNVAQQGAVKNLKAKLQTVETDAGTLVSSAKGDFPSEASAIQSSASSLKTGAQQLPSSPTPQQVAVLAKDAKGLVTSFQAFKKASDSKCS